MLISMTGYGSARLTEGEFVVDAEVRSVNNRFLKISFRGPEVFTRSQFLFEELARSKISRGTLDLTLRLQYGQAEGGHALHLDVLEKYYRQLLEAQRKLNLQGPIEIAWLANLPGVVESAEVIEEEDLARRLTDAALEATRQALDALGVMRRVEGQTQHAAFCQMLDEILALSDAVDKRRPAVLLEHQERLRARVQELIQDSGITLAAEDLAREVAIFAERSDIAEETHRLQSHVAQFRQTCDRPEAVGRRLEFLAQEMHREINTMGSKANDAALSVLIVDLKGIVERIREQVMNVE